MTLDQDGAWQLGDLALLDFEDASGACANGTAGMNTTLRGTVPEGEYTGLSFTIGVPCAGSGFRRQSPSGSRNQ